MADQYSYLLRWSDTYGTKCDTERIGDDLNTKKSSFDSVRSQCTEKMNQGLWARALSEKLVVHSTFHRGSGFEPLSA